MSMTIIGIDRETPTPLKYIKRNEYRQLSELEENYKIQGVFVSAKRKAHKL